MIVSGVFTKSRSDNNNKVSIVFFIYVPKCYMTIFRSEIECIRDGILLLWQGNSLISIIVKKKL